LLLSEHGINLRDKFFVAGPVVSLAGDHEEYDP